MEDWKQFIKNLIANNFFFTKITNPEDVSSPIVKALQGVSSDIKELYDKEESEAPTKEISDPIVKAIKEASSDTIKSIESIEKVEKMEITNIGEAKVDFTEVVSVLKELLAKDTNVLLDNKSVVKAIKDLEKAVKSSNKEVTKAVKEDISISLELV